MNNKRRKQIKENIDMLEVVKCNLENILNEEQDYFDNMPENLQGSIRGEVSEEAIDLLNEVIDLIGDCIDNLNGIE